MAAFRGLSFVRLKIGDIIMMARVLPLFSATRTSVSPLELMADTEVVVVVTLGRSTHVHSISMIWIMTALSIDVKCDAL